MVPGSTSYQVRYCTRTGTIPADIPKVHTCGSNLPQSTVIEKKNPHFRFTLTKCTRSCRYINSYPGLYTVPGTTVLRNLRVEGLWPGQCPKNKWYGTSTRQYQAVPVPGEAQRTNAKLCWRLRGILLTSTTTRGTKIRRPVLRAFARVRK